MTATSALPADLEAHLARAAALVNDPAPVSVAADTALYLGIDLGTSDVVSMAVDADGVPLAVCLEWADVVRDGVVLAFFEAVQIVRAQVEAILATTGEFLWVDSEKQLDAVTALSGSGPAYVFYFLEAMARAGTAMGLSPAQAHQLAVGTFVGASELARRSDEPPAVLRQRVTSKGGTTYAALQSMEADGVGAAFERAMQAACQRADELGNEFGA